MNLNFDAWGLLRHLTWAEGLLILGVLVAARVAVGLSRWALRRAAERAPARWRLTILQAPPLVRLAIDVTAVAVIVPMLVEPTFHKVTALLASVGLVLAFGLKDFGSSLVAGVITVLEHTYQPGDWITVDGAYGEVKSIGLRSVRLVTADDTEVIVPHAKIWSAGVHNASSGNRSLLCVANFYLHPAHDAAKARHLLADVATTSRFRRKDTQVFVAVLEQPWGTQYRVKAYVKESREQYEFITDLTTRGKDALRTRRFRFAQAPYAATGLSGGK